MKSSVRWLFALLLGSALVGSIDAGGDEDLFPTTSHLPELEYLKAVNRAGPPQDPQLLFLLMGQFANANMQREGIEFFSARVKEFEPQLSDRQKSLYLAAIGLLRAQYANDVSLLKRMGWVKETVATLEDAKRLSGGEIFPVRWISGVVYAQLPGVFKQRDAARADLMWCVENADKAPHEGWLREVYYQLAALDRAAGRDSEARRYLALSGYPDFTKRVTLTAPYSEDPS